MNVRKGLCIFLNLFFFYVSSTNGSDPYWTKMNIDTLICDTFGINSITKTI